LSKDAEEHRLTNPVLIELTRGERVESVHRGAIAIAHADGSLALALGDVETPVYPRSSLKPVQALPLVESGAADAFGLGSEEIALACASHSGEPMHATRVAAWLSRIGCGESDLACGAHPVRYEPVWEEMVRRGEKPTRIHNNCSGKHTGFLTVARHWDIATAGYEHHDHPVQQAVEKTLLELSGLSGALPWGVDGCAAPNFALPLSGFARALAKMADPKGLSDTRAKASRRIVHAMTEHPELVSGTGRVCATFMRAAGKRAAVKTGAEGFFAGIVPEMGLGIALKIDDGAGRGAETAMAAILAKLKLIDERGPAGEILRAPVTNTRGKVVGERRPAPALADAVISH
jgi:L-asparaginase II